LLTISRSRPKPKRRRKTLHCRDAGFDCEGVIEAATEEEILSQAAEHAQAAHNVQVTSELAEQLKALTKDEE
jgi:predicted small metal-binding protein